MAQISRWKSGNAIPNAIPIQINKPCDFAETFLKHFQSIFSRSCLGDFYDITQSTELLSLTHVSNSVVDNAKSYGQLNQSHWTECLH
jgi:hypothetical protein